jgi:alcohol dehydrogenase (cytochrome c)
MQFLSSRPKALGFGVLAVAASVGVVAAASASQPTASVSAAASAWSMANGNSQGTRDVNSSISASNVGKLGVAWSLPLSAAASAFGNYATTPVISHGVVYTQDLQSNVYAVKLSTGKLLWEKKYNSPDVGPNGVAVAGGTVYGATSSKVFALQASTGEQVWTKSIVRNKGEGIDMAPAYHDGTVYVSTVPGNLNGFYTGDGVAVLWAMNAKTGAEKWKWQEVPTNLWGNKKVNSGGGQWQPPTFDAQGHLFLNVANPAPYVGDKAYPGKKVYAWGSSHPGKNLYTDSVVELNPATGKMMWYYQLIPHDVLDWDLNNQALITTVNGKEAIISAGKAGIAIANDAKTGKLLWKVKMGKRTGFDNANILAMEGKYNQLPKLPFKQFPGNWGGVESPYASNGSTVFMPINNLVYNVSTQTKAAQGNPLSGTGEMVAIDQNTGKVKWVHKFPHSPYGASTVTNNLVLTTTFDGTVWALNATTGKVVWKHALPAGTNAPLAVDGNMIVLGAGYPEGKGQSAALVAFKLGAHGSFSSTGSSGGKGKGGTV